MSSEKSRKLESDLTAANVRVKELEKATKDAATSKGQEVDDLKQQYDQLKETSETSMRDSDFFEFNSHCCGFNYLSWF